MKTVGIIAEYNPFHTGHQYQVSYIREKCQADHVVIAMSGDYVQRGTPALFSKHIRARMALAGGADLVLELPVEFSAGSAQNFAIGGVMLLDKLGVVDELCFGSECADVSLLMELARILEREPDAYQTLLQQFLKEGCSFPAARSQALLAFIMDSSLHQTACSRYSLEELTEILASPNNILGIEYCKALLHQNSGIKPVSLARKGSGYHEMSLLEHEYPSASAIRGVIRETMGGSSYIEGDPGIGGNPDSGGNSDSEGNSDSISALLQKSVPDPVGRLMLSELQHRRFVLEEDLDEPLFYRLLLEDGDSLCSYLDMSENLARRIQNHKNEFQSFSQFAKALNTKESTQTRIQRALLHTLLQIRHCPAEVPYARVLGFRKTGSPLLKEIKERSQIPMVTKLADASGFLSEAGREMLRENVFCSHVYEGILSRKSKQPFVHEYEKSPIIL